MPDDTDLPLSPVELAVLLCLEQDGPAYGYAVVKGIAARSMGAIRIAPGNLYQVLDRMMARGWIEPAPAPGYGDARRRYYAVTESGRQAVRAEAARLRAMLPALTRLDSAQRGGT